MTFPATGGCLCGAIRYTVDAPMQSVIACHCRNCRKASGAGASHNVLLKTEALKFTKGEPKRYVDTADSGNALYRFFCPECGGSIYSQRSTAPQMLVLKAGSLDDAAGLSMGMHIWTDSAVPWMHRDPTTAQFPKNRPVPAPT
jgi:hypothetical protein